jgi:hypothetical protein
MVGLYPYMYILNPMSHCRVLRRIFRLRREEMAGGWRTLYNEELHNLHASLNIIRVIRSRRVRWVRHVAGMG